MSTTLADEEDDGINPVHLLLVGESKIGKTDYICDMAEDGFTLLYIDADNGKNTLKKRLKNNAAALARVHYVRTGQPFEFCINLFYPKKTFHRWNLTRDTNGVTGADDDELLLISPDKIPPGVVIVLDSWTSAMFDLLQDAAKRNNVSFETFNEGGTAAYGDAYRRANQLCGYMRDSPNHIVAQGHPINYEQLEKPKGVSNPKQKDMVIVGNHLVPESCSKPHGFTMSKFFNEVGWMRVNDLRKTVLDFRLIPGRVGAGSPLAEGDPKKEFRFSKIFREPETISDSSWIRKITVAEYKAEQPAPPPKAEPSKPTVAVTQPGVTAAAPAKTLPGAGLLKTVPAGIKLPGAK